MSILKRGYNQNLNGLNPLGYVGVNSQNPPNIVIKSVAPTINDSKNFYVGDLWVVVSDPSGSEQAYMLVNLIGNEATWLQLSGGGGGTVQSLTADTGGPVLPTAGNINTLGGEMLNTVGNPGTSTVTVNLDRGTNGQVPIAATGSPTLYNTLTAGTGILITNGMNSITISSLDEGATVGFLGKLETPSGFITGDSEVVFMGKETGAFTTIVNDGSAFTPGNGTTTPATFTAPVTGLYHLEIACQFFPNLGGQPNFTVLVITTSNRTYVQEFNTATAVSQYFHVIADMDSGDTAIFSASASNSNPDDVALGATDTYVAGALLNASAAAGNPLTVHTDNGDAVEMSDAISVLGGELINTSGATDVVTINLDRGTNGQIPIAATGSATAYANLTSSDSSIVITNGANSIDLKSQFAANFYEEGPWTPILSFGGSSTGITYSFNEAYYVRTGNVVYINAGIFLTSKGSAAGSAIVSGLPFTASTTDGEQFPDVMMSAVNFIQLSSGYTWPHAVINGGTTNMNLRQNPTVSSLQSINLTNANFVNTSQFKINGNYIVSVF